ncbi:MAG: hypothetical protein RXR06_11445 [Thermoproteus sp.]
MSQLATEERIEILIEEAKKILKQYGLSGTTKLMNKAAVAALCGPPIEQRRISLAKQIESVTTATGRYPYVVFAFQSHGVLCVPDANYYVADGLYDVHVIDCAGREALCAEVAAIVSDVFDIPLQKEALLLLADERTLCERHLLPLSTCVGERGRGSEEEPEEERKERRGERVSAAVNKFRAELAAAAAVATARGQPPQPPPPQQPSLRQPPSSPQLQPPSPDPKAVLKEVGLGWLAPIVDDPASAAVLRFIVTNKEVLDALKDEEKRKIVAAALKEGGVSAAPPSTWNKALEKWSPKDREKLLLLLSKTRDLYSLASALSQYLVNDHCTFDVVMTILDTAAERYGLTCEAVAQMLSQ